MALYDELNRGIYAVEAAIPMPGVENPVARDALILQMIDSIRRIKYVAAIASRPISAARGDPTGELFDPVRAAVLSVKDGRLDDAGWFVFLFTHFGKHGTTGWRLARDIYGGLGEDLWSWGRVRASPADFRAWLAQNLASLKGGDGTKRHFGNHRKYESLEPYGGNGTGEVFESYVSWVGASHAFRFEEALHEAHGHGGNAFHHLYESMSKVSRFGRTARFDYLTMVGKVGLASIYPQYAYLSGATGPLRGARLLFGGSASAQLSAAKLEYLIAKLNEEVETGMQVMEDSLCNWQKSPLQYNRFYG